jgi:hypothetical protein
MPSIEDVKNDPDLKFMIPDDTLVDIPKSRYENYDNLPLTTKSESIPENDKLNKEFELPPKIKELGNYLIEICVCFLRLIKTSNLSFCNKDLKNFS